MNNNINLISNQNVELEKELRRLKKFKLISLACLIVVSLLSIVVFILNLTLPLDSVKKEQNITAASIALLHEKLVTYNLITDRVKNISNILSQRGNYIPQTDEILAKVPADVSVEGLDIQKGKTSISVSSMSLVPMSKLIDDMVGFAAQGKVIKNLVIEGLSLDAGSGRYSLDMKADIP